MSESNLKSTVWFNNNLTRLEMEQHGTYWSMVVSYRQGFPRFSISQVIEGRAVTKITLATTPVMLDMVLSFIETVAKSDDSDIVKSVEHKNNIFINGERTNELAAICTVSIFKINGLVYIQFKFKYNETDKRLVDMKEFQKDNSVQFLFPIKSNRYFVVGDEESAFALSYANLMKETNAIYTTLYNEKYHTTEN